MGNSGSSDSWSPAYGASKSGRGVRFRVWAPGAKEVSLLAGEGASQRSVRMDPNGDVHEAAIEADEGLRYRFSLDGGSPMPDPASLSQPEGVHGPSMVVDTSFKWHDEKWKGVPAKDLAIYELHTGTFTRDGTFEGIIPRLEHLKRRLGVTAVELMPVGQFPGDRDWGYDGVFPYAAQSTYGGAKGMAKLVDACHSEGLAVILDVVYNHLGPEGNCLPRYGPYFSDNYRTPWGAALNFDGPGSDAVRRYVVDNALFWVRGLHVDGLRLDAIHAIFDSSPKHILQQLAEEVHAAGAREGREVLVIGESDLNDPRVVRGEGECGYGLDAQWSDDLHHSVHTALTGERFGYYQDYHGASDVARAFAEPFVLDGGFSRYRKRKHGAPSTGVPGERFVVFAQNHDQVGNRADGARLTVLSGPGGAKVAAAAAVLSPYTPLIFMGEEFGSRAPFYYFCDYSDPEIVRKTREGRRRELEEQGGAFVDPQAPEMREVSRPDHGEAGSTEGEVMLEFYSSLIRFRREHPAVRAPRSNSEISLTPKGDGVLVRRWEGDDGVFLVFAFGASVQLDTSPTDGEWKVALSSSPGAPGRLVPGVPTGFPGRSASAYVRD